MRVLVLRVKKKRKNARHVINSGAFEGKRPEGPFCTADLEEDEEVFQVLCSRRSLLE